MPTPLDKIDDGYEFQRIVAEYFRCLKTEKHDYTISSVKVEDYGIGQDNGCDIVVDFVFDDPITEHSKRWIIECKSQKQAVGPAHIKMDNIQTLLDANNASGYLLVCKSDATSSVKERFRFLNEKNNGKMYKVWNGSQLWRELSQRETILKAFFNDYYRLNSDLENKDVFEMTYRELEKKIRN
nr:restriction endonuclease [uncultured Allomuricauda sp.]